MFLCCTLHLFCCMRSKSTHEQMEFPCKALDFIFVRHSHLWALFLMESKATAHRCWELPTGSPDSVILMSNAIFSEPIGLFYMIHQHVEKDNCKKNCLGESKGQRPEVQKSKICTFCSEMQTKFASVFKCSDTKCVLSAPLTSDIKIRNARLLICTFHYDEVRRERIRTRYAYVLQIHFFVSNLAKVKVHW